MTVIDFIIIVFCIFHILKGLWKGFLLEVFNLLALVTGLAAASNFSSLVSEQLESIFSLALVRDTVSYCGVFVLVWLAIKIMGWMLDKSMGEAETRIVSRLTGGFLGLAKAVLIVSAVVYMVESGFPENKITGANLSTPICLTIGQWVTEKLPFLFASPFEPQV